MRSCDSRRYMNPREIMSGVFLTSRRFWSMNTMMMNMPSCARVFRSWTTISWMGASVCPSTDTAVVSIRCFCFLIIFPSELMSMMEPFSGMTNESCAMPRSRSMWVCALSM